MYSSPDDRKADETYHELEKEIMERRKKEKNPLNRLTPKMRIGLAAAIAVGIWYVTTYKVPTGKALLWGGAFLIVIYILLSGEPDMRKLTERECAESLYHKLRDMQKHPLGVHKRVVDGRIEIGYVGKERWLNGRPWKRELGFGIVNEDGVRKTFSAEINVWDGDLIAIRERFGGFTGHEVRDTEIVMSRDLRFEKARDQYLKPGGKSGGIV